MAKISPATFVAQVRAEASKVVWPNRKETVLTTVMVLILSTIAALLFLLIDMLLSLGVNGLLELGA